MSIGLPRMSRYSREEVREESSMCSTSDRPMQQCEMSSRRSCELLMICDSDSSSLRRPHPIQVRQALDDRLMGEQSGHSGERGVTVCGW